VIFCEKKKDLTCPLILFRQQLVKQIKKWRAEGDRIIIFMDHNEHVYNRALRKTLSDSEGLNFQEVILQHTGTKTGATFFRGSKPIDGLWASSNLEISNPCIMPFGYSVEDHRAFILDITLELLIGENPTKIVCPVSRKLNSRLPQCGEEYIQSFELTIILHCLLECLHDAHTGEYMPEERASKVIKINEEGKAYMRHAEKNCRKIKTCKIPFSPKASIWIRQAQVYYSLLYFHQGKVKNQGNLKRTARCCNIPNLLSLTVAKILERLKACKKECLFYQEHGQRFHKKHLANQLKILQEKEDDKAITKIGAIIQHEQQRSFWRKLNFVTGKKRTRSATSVQVEDQSGAILEHTTKDLVEDSIFSEVHNKRYTMAGEAPICKGELFKDFGYVANTPASIAVLDRAYAAPQDSDSAT
jgi:hypothetical protein